MTPRKWKIGNRKKYAKKEKKEAKKYKMKHFFKEE
jgi:hypothetical protein